jgi:hypothetical protein
MKIHEVSLQNYFTSIGRINTPIFYIAALKSMIKPFAVQAHGLAILGGTSPALSNLK